MKVDEIVAKVMAGVEDNDSLMNGTIARSAAEIALEEAAKVAESQADIDEDTAGRLSKTGEGREARTMRTAMYTGRRIASAIRAMRGT